MGAYSAVVLAVIAAIVGVAAGSYYPDLTPDQFDKVLDGKQHALLEFYAPWCGHCKKLAPEYEKLGKVFEGSDDVVIAQIDADKHRSLAKDFGIKGYPTLKWVSKGKDARKDSENVNVARTADALIEFVGSRSGVTASPPKEETKVVELTEDNFTQIVDDENKHALVEFFAPWCGHCKRLKPIYDQLSMLFDGEDDVVIGAVDCEANKGICNKYDISGYPTLKWFPKENKKNPMSYESGRDIASFVSWLNEKAGTDLDVSGGVKEGAGVVMELADLAKSFLSGGESSFAESAKQMEAQAAGLTGRTAENAKYYYKVAKNSMEKGADYAKNEKERLQKLMSQANSMTKAQARSMQRRINALSAFAGGDLESVKEAVKEAEEEDKKEL